MDEADVFEPALYDARVGKGSVARLESLANALLDGTGLNLEKISEMSPEGLRVKIIAACERKRISDVFSQDAGLLLLVKEAAKNAEKELVNIPLRDIRKSAEADISGTFGMVVLIQWQECGWPARLPQETPSLAVRSSQEKKRLLGKANTAANLGGPNFNKIEREAGLLRFLLPFLPQEGQLARLPDASMLFIGAFAY